MKRALAVFAFVAAAPCVAQQGQQGQQESQAQQQGQAVPGLEVRAFPLVHLSQADAARLISPFIVERSGGVFEAGAVNAVTVRASKNTLAKVDSLLRVFDRPQPMVNLRFQLIAAVDSVWRDPDISRDVDSTLRATVPYRGYRVVAQSTMVVSAGNYEITLSSGQLRYVLSGRVYQFVGDAAQGIYTGIQLGVNLSSRRSLSPESSTERTMSTTATLPFGQTLVVGGLTHHDGHQLILVLKPVLHR